MTDKIWVATTVYRNKPRWAADGHSSLETFIDGVAFSETLARDFIYDCSEEPLRWFQSAGGSRSIAAHRERGEWHFHLVSQEELRTAPILTT
jgi:hypothetical protein